MFPIATLTDTTGSKLGYLARAVPISVIPALFASLLIGQFAGNVEKPEFPFEPLMLLFMLVLVAPLAETLLMWPVIYLLGKVRSLSAVGISAVSALLWALIHSLQVPVWGLTVLWPFFVFSLCFVSWRKVSRKAAIGMTILVHASQNLLAALYMLSVQS